MMRVVLTVLLLLVSPFARALDRPGVEYRIFQFPASATPRIDGKTEDWKMVPSSYVIDSSHLVDVGRDKLPRNPKDLDVRVTVGWVAGESRLYFLYEAFDDHWEFTRADQHNDLFEVVVDGDMSGGPLIKDMHPEARSASWALYRAVQGVHAQNWHIFTPAQEKDWVMVWGCQQPWIRELPWANAVYRHDVRPGKPGRLVLEFFITPFDHASCDGPGRSTPSQLQEGKAIGLSWAVKDYDAAGTESRAFWTLSRKMTMYGDASDLVRFRLAPLEPSLRKPVEAQWSFQVVDRARRLVAFQDRSWSSGTLTTWRWDFGDGQTSTERHPIHRYTKGGEYVVTLRVEGTSGKARLSKVWDVVLE